MGEQRGEWGQGEMNGDTGGEWGNREVNVDREVNGDLGT